MNYRRSLFASMAAGPHVYFSPDDPAADQGGGDTVVGSAETGAGEGGDGGGEGGEDTTASGADAGVETGVAPEPEPKPTRIPWQNKRIDKLTAENKTAQEERDRFRQQAEKSARQIAAYQALYGDVAPKSGETVIPAAPSGPKTYTEEDVQREAGRRAEMASLNQTLDGMFETGKKTYGDAFEKQVQAAGQAFGQALGQRVDLFKAIAKLPNGTDVYHSLTSDLDHMAEVLEMDPMDLGMELSRMSTTASKPVPKVVSKVPAPPEPLGGNGGRVDGADDMDSYAKDYNERRQKRAQERGY